MERRVVRRIAVNGKRSKQWDASWLDPIKHAAIHGATRSVFGAARFMSTLDSTLDRHSKGLLRFGGIAGIYGGIIWILLLILLELQTYNIIPYDAFNSEDMFAKLLILPFLLFICSTLGMLVSQQQRLSRFGYVAILIILIGSGFLARSVISNYWLGPNWNGYGIIPSLNWRPINLWLNIARPDLFVVALGLVFLIVANGRAKTLPRPETLFLIGSLIAVLSLPEAKEGFGMPYGFGLSIWPLALFGVGWILMGIALLLSNRKGQHA